MKVRVRKALERLEKLPAATQKDIIAQVMKATEQLREKPMF